MGVETGGGKVVGDGAGEGPAWTAAVAPLLALGNCWKF